MQEHLATFAGGMFALGSQLLSRSQDLLMGAELTESAVWAYRSTATGLMPEISKFNLLDKLLPSLHKVGSGVLRTSKSAPRVV